MAFRLGQGLGFHRDPKNWASLSRPYLQTVDLEFRRRVYWGCFVSDKCQIPLSHIDASANSYQIIQSVARQAHMYIRERW